MKKLFLIATTALVATCAKAEVGDLQVKFNGRFNFQGAFRNQSKLDPAEKKLSANRRNAALASNAFVSAKVEAENEMMKYGANIALFSSTRITGSPAYDRSHIFLESDAGKLELGSNFDCGTKMRITAMNIARAGGDDAADYAMITISKDPYNSHFAAPMYPSFFFDPNNLDANNRESSRKITYYTPTFNGLQLGVSYIPDSGNLGYGTAGDTDDKYNKAVVTKVKNGAGNLVATYSEKKPIKDAISAGLTFTHELANDTHVQLALTGEFGKAAYNGEKTVPAVPAAGGNPAIPEQKTNYKLAKLQTYNIGGIVTKGNFSFAASYTDLGKSMTSEEIYGKDRKTRYYTVGAAYAQGPVGISLTYVKADQRKNKMDIYTLSTDYKLAPGFMPYAEVAYYKGKAGMPAVFNSTDPKRKIRGVAFIVGAKVMF